jgi:hypothetical protein
MDEEQRRKKKEGKEEREGRERKIREKGDRSLMRAVILMRKTEGHVSTAIKVGNSSCPIRLCYDTVNRARDGTILDNTEDTGDPVELRENCFPKHLADNIYCEATSTARNTYRLVVGGPVDRHPVLACTTDPPCEKEKEPQREDVCDPTMHDNTCFKCESPDYNLKY